MLTQVKTYQNYFFSGLNEQQLNAANVSEGPVVLIACAGSGKSTTMTRRLGSMLVHNNVDPAETLTLTFTKKASMEMSAKLRQNIQNHYAIEDYGVPFDQLDQDKQYEIAPMVYNQYMRHLNIGTFHSVCSRLLRRNISSYQEEGRRWTPGFSFMEPKTLTAKVKEVAYKEMNLDNQKFILPVLTDAISKFKRACLIPEDVIPKNFAQETYLEIYKEVRKFQHIENMIDFDDMIMMTARLLSQNSEIRARYHNTFRHISCDEMQDTDEAQYSIMKSLACNGLLGSQFTDWTNRSLFVVGDLDQSIYSWRGAEMRILLDFEKDFKNGTEKHDVKILKIEHNYRSTSTITGAANELIKNNQVRIDKNIIPSRDAGSKIQVIQKNDNVEEAKFIAAEIRKLKMADTNLKWSDFAVLIRKNAFTLQIEKALTAQGIPYVIGGGWKFSERKEIKTILSYLRLMTTPEDNAAFNYIVNIPKRGIGATTVNRIFEECREQEISAWDFLSQCEDLKEVLGRSHKAVFGFIEFMNELKQEAHDMDIVDVINLIIQKANLNTYFANDSDSSESAEERQDNMSALVSVASDFIHRQPEGSISDFIDQMVLDGVEAVQEENVDAVRVMTVHASKGLEFNTVFIAAMEHGSFPCKPDYMTPDSLEEARRLFYVAVTRAKDRLYLTWAKNRWVRKTTVDSRGRRESYEELETMIPSPFIAEIPREYLYSAMEAM